MEGGVCGLSGQNAALSVATGPRTGPGSAPTLFLNTGDETARDYPVTLAAALASLPAPSTASGMPGMSGRTAPSAAPMEHSSELGPSNLQSTAGKTARDQRENHNSATHSVVQVATTP